MLKARGMTVVMTTNYLDEADELWTGSAIIDGGIIKTIGSPVELESGFGRRHRVADAQRGGPNPGVGIGLERAGGDQGSEDAAKEFDIRVESPEKALPIILSRPMGLDAVWSFIQYNRPSVGRCVHRSYGESHGRYSRR